VLGRCGGTSYASCSGSDSNCPGPSGVCYGGAGGYCTIPCKTDSDCPRAPSVKCFGFCTLSCTLTLPCPQGMIGEGCSNINGGTCRYP
jgi:hypothetical protein